MAAPAPAAAAAPPNVVRKRDPLGSTNRGQVTIDYDSLVAQHNTERISDELLARFEKVTKKPLHRFLRRHQFFSHRSLSEILDRVEKGLPFYIYTYRGASQEPLHLGHIVPLIFAKYLQDAFDVPVVVQLTDDEKFFFKNYSLEEAHAFALESAKDIVAMGFDVSKTFIFTNYDYVGKMYPNVAKIQKLLTANQVRTAMGLLASAEDNIGKYSYAAIQVAPAFSSSFPDIFGTGSAIPALIPCGIDQDPFFRLAREVASRLLPSGYAAPAVLHCKFFPSLRGVNSKMIASDPTAVIFMTDTQKEIATKVNKYVFSGGRDTVEEHRQRGANVEVDVSIAALGIFLEDDAKLKQITEAYGKGELLTSQVKSELISVLQPLIAAHQKARAAVTKEQVDKFFTPRPLHCYGKELPVTAKSAKPAK